MGGKPILAIAILGWPIDKLAPEVAQQVLEGARAICSEAGIALAGGHSIDCPEPVFGLAVNGLLAHNELKQNSTAKAGNLLYLTKPLGVGILTTAQKKNVLLTEHENIAPDSMKKLNKAGEMFGKLPYVTAMTDVTGFGLLGHLSEMCEGSHLNAIIQFNKVSRIDVVDYYLELQCIPGGTNRNWKSYGDKIHPITEYQKHVLADPQTSGGLLVAIEPAYQTTFEKLLQDIGLPPANCISIGEMHPYQKGPCIKVED
jgi:selenide,water dikinase